MMKTARKMGRKRKFAPFDVDGTIFRSSLLVELVEVLIERGFFPKAARARYVDEQKKWLDRKDAEGGTYDNYIMAVVHTFEHYVRRIGWKEVQSASKVVIARHKNHVYRYTRDLIAKLKKKGYFLLAVSQSPKFLLDAFCKELGFDKVYGRIYEINSKGFFTGKTMHLDQIADKAVIIRRAMAKENLTLKGSVGVGDTHGDSSMLEMVEHPICFNPNEKLYSMAEKRSWKIVIERKDIAVEINGVFAKRVTTVRIPS